MARTTKKTTRRAPARGPANTSRAAGAPAPASAAATQASFYNPTDQQEDVASPLATAHVREVRAQAVPTEEEGRTFDPSLHPDYDAPAAGGDLSSEIDRIRKIRKPLGAFSQKLALPVRRDYHRHWFNDVAGRVSEALNNGWAHVMDDERKPIKRVVGVGRDNGALYAYAMEIPEVFWQEDMNARHEAAAEKVEGLKASPFRAPQGSAKAADAGKFYSPKEGADPLQVVKANH